jgi:hypothetical protein
MLLDQRYHRPAIRSQLPRWIAERVVCATGFGETLRPLCQFFKAHAQPK